ncbi:iron chelate uptake ABC transporter family permease subunit [Thermobifida halotolerans]|uniref:Iron chelate uptake ABC transporter family permease subunit n=1 Tax=Thermobifida halotolerans TaxID=483545 RepID=A0A399G7X9_9ACTN|nr:iron chelate uptake ABC transporter family permease subunit [Thermobifida halotolerans]UOE20767.1 iron chelate uptake ABC transporter family permease subunit [Thermobifida halotolerans]
MLTAHGTAPTVESLPAPEDPLRVARKSLAVAVGIALCASLTALSLFVGSGDLTWSQSWDALTGHSASPDGIIVREYRVPRTLLAIVVGAALGAAGAVIQAVTRNPLADPGLLGVNSGAFLAVAVGAAFLGVSGVAGQVWLGLAGALATAVVVHLVGTSGRQGRNPVHLVLAGIAIGAVLNGVGHGVTLLAPEVFDRIRFWQVGSLQGRQIDVLWGVLPFVAAGLVITVALTRSLNTLALGDDLARSLGSRVLLVRGLGFTAITLLCGAATAAVGPVSFLGLMVPHAVRAVVGPDQRWIVPLSLVAAPVVFLGADILGRVVIAGELPVGIVTAFVGSPVLVWLVRRTEVKAP